MILSKNVDRIIKSPPVVVQRVQVVLEEPLNSKEMKQLEECRRVYSEEAKKYHAVEERF